MVSKTLAFALALTSVVSAAPALRARQDDCRGAYDACIAAGTAEVVCQCKLLTCSGEDSARLRDYCATATAGLAQSTAAATTYACNPAHSYPNGASCVSTNGALTLVTPAATTTAATATTYACNPAHSYPNGQSCISSGTGLTLVGPATTTATAAATTYACNPAHSYPNGASCVSTNGGLTLVTPAATTAAPAATTYACNPAHSYPNGASCVSTNGGLSLVTPAATSVPSSVASSVAAAPTGVAPGSNPVKVDGKTWKVNNLIRYCVEGNTGCDYNFDIVANGKTEHCTVSRMPGSNAATESWSNQNCTSGSEFKVSWGYAPNPAPAFAVLTVVDNKELAWFGVSDINGKPVSASSPYGSGSFGNLTEQPVYTYN